MNVSRGTVSRIQRKAIRKLKHPSRVRKLFGYGKLLDISDWAYQARIPRSSSEGDDEA